MPIAAAPAPSGGEEPETMNIISRSEWGARAPRNRQTVSWSQRTEVVVHYSEGPTDQTVRSIQDFHMGPSRGWADIGYNFLVDTRGRIYEGRGWLVVGAHAPGHNTSGIGVCMIGRDGDATPAALRAIRWVYDEACRRAGRSLKKLGHRDVYNTSCPGNQLWKWVHDGMPVDNIQEDDMPEYVSVGMTEEQDLPPGEWVTVNWGKEYSDSTHHHWDKGGPSLIVGPGRYSLMANIQIEGLPPGTELQARAFEVNEDDGKVDSNGPIHEYAATGGKTFVDYQLAADTVNAKCRVRFQVVHFGDVTAKVTGGFAKGFVWPTS